MVRTLADAFGNGVTLAVVRITFGNAGGTSCRVEASVEMYMCRMEGVKTVVRTAS